MFDISPMLAQPFGMAVFVKNAKTPMTDKIKEIYDNQGKEAAIKWLMDQPESKITKVFGERSPAKTNPRGWAEARLEDALKNY